MLMVVRHAGKQVSVAWKFRYFEASSLIDARPAAKPKTGREAEPVTCYNTTWPSRNIEIRARSVHGTIGSFQFLRRHEVQAKEY